MTTMAFSDGAVVLLQSSRFTASVRTTARTGYYIRSSSTYSFRSRSSLIREKRTTSARRWRHTGARAPAPRSRRLPAGLAPISVTARAADDAEKSIADTYTGTPETRAHAASVAVHTHVLCTFGESRSHPITSMYTADPSRLHATPPKRKQCRSGQFKYTFTN
ncbi:unnamed protein product [Aphis gossypii]|uniref:Uncharacterized protein n=1 Tax=Aphis gossypii TaxID=80765 RepID=A0A9P0JK35_APHGO|nr:unnamed protein product [Aphis gossypii]